MGLIAWEDADFRELVRQGGRHSVLRLPRPPDTVGVGSDRLV